MSTYQYGDYTLTEAQAILADGLIEDVVFDDPNVRFRDLTPKESRFVRILVAAKGRTVRHQTLAEAIAHDPTDPPMAPIVKTYVCRIRKARPDVGEHIELDWGKGYRWSGPLDFLDDETDQNESA